MMLGQCPWCGESVGYGTSFWSMGLMLLFGLMVIMGIVLLVVWLARSAKGPEHMPMQTTDPALESARRRYASGEITKEQFDEIRRILSS